MKTSNRLSRGDYDIAYQFTAGNSPCLVFCAGFNSNMQGNKATAFEQYCQSTGQAYVRFDYQGHGDSGGDFGDGCISTWLGDVLGIIDEVAEGDVILIGSSMGGWLALLAALRRPERVRGLVLLACAADMTRHYDARIQGLAIRNDSLGRAFYSAPNRYDDQQPYRIYQHLLDDGSQYSLLDRNIKLDIPVHLIHGILDDVVPWQRSQQVMEQLTSKDVHLHLVKNGDHRLSTASNLELLTSILAQMLKVY